MRSSFSIGRALFGGAVAIAAALAVASCLLTHSFEGYVGSDAGEHDANCTIECDCLVSPPSAPRPPTTYQLPAGALEVATAEQLVTALAAPDARDIVLADGTYAPSAMLKPLGPHRLWAKNLGRAVLQAGIDFGTNDGPPGGEIHGISFVVSDPAKSLFGAIVNVWGERRNVKVADCRFDGGSKMSTALMARQPSGLVVERVVVENVVDWGLLIDPNDSAFVANPIPQVTDVEIRGVRRVGSGGPTDYPATGIWFGLPAAVQRVRVRTTPGICTWLGQNIHDAKLVDLDLDGCETGISIEKSARLDQIQNFAIGPNVQRGIYSAASAGDRNIVQHGSIDSHDDGVIAEMSTQGMIIRNVIFRSQTEAAIVDRGSGTTTACNDYKLIAPGASSISKR